MADQLPRERLPPLAALSDRALATFGYEMSPLIDAVGEAIPGMFGLFDPQTNSEELSDAFERILDANGRSVPRYHDREAEAGEFVLCVDGSSRRNPGAAGAGAVILSGTGETLIQLGRPIGSKAGNNITEYAALHLGLDQLMRRYRPAAIEVRTDSTTVAGDIWGEQDGSEAFRKYSREISTLLDAVPRHDWTHLPDSEPNPADALATVGTDLSALDP